MKVLSQRKLLALIATAVAFSARTRAVDMTLTQDGINAGFHLATFATGFTPSAPNGIGPFGIGFVGDGEIIGSWYEQKVYSFATDTDNQVANPTYSVTTNGNPAGMTMANGHNYMIFQNYNIAGYGHNLVAEVDQYGQYVSTLADFGPRPMNALMSYGNSVYASSSWGDIYQIDATTKAVTQFQAKTGAFDGMSVSSDGTRLYAELNNGADFRVLGFDTTTKSQIFDSGFIDGADGTALGSRTLDGYIYVNTNKGELWQVKLSDSTQTLIASGGSRGDLAAVDPRGNTSLFLTQSSSVLRLTHDTGGFQYGNGVANVPEPSTYAMATIATGTLAWMARRRKKASIG